MGIAQDQAHVTIEFDYESDDGSQRYSVKYHTVSNVPTITVSDDGGQSWYDFPASFFEETVAFIAEQKSGIVKPKLTQRSAQDTVPGLQNSMSSLKDKSSLPATTIGNTGDVDNTGDVEEKDMSEIPEPVKLGDNKPLETFSGIEDLASMVSASTAKKDNVEENKQIYNRPVIRGENDPLVTQRTANPDKVMKRRED